MYVPCAIQQWMESIEDLKIHLLDKNTSSSTVDTIVYYLQSWRSTDYDKYNKVSISSSSLSEAILAQEYIGWQAFMKGYLSLERKIHKSTFLTKNRVLGVEQQCW